MLAVIQTHPVQYHAPVWRHLQQVCGVPVTAIYGSDFSVVGYKDQDMNVDLAWDASLLAGYRHEFLSHVAAGGAKNDREASTAGLGAALRRIQPRAILLSGYWPRFCSEAFLAAWCTGVPLLFRGETTDLGKPRSAGKAMVRDVLLRVFYRRFAGLLYVGERSRQHFHRLGVGSRSNFFSPYSVDVSPMRTDEVARAELRPVCRQELALEPDQMVVMFCGKLYGHKRPDDLVAAARELPEAMRARLVLLLVGDGMMAEDLKRQAAAVPSLTLRHVGFQKQRDLSRFYHAADMLALPSMGETWGLVVNEALHHGLPVVVSDTVGSAPDLVESGRTGEVFPVGSRVGLAKAIRRVAERAGRAEIRELCRAKVADYSVAHAAEGIAAAYRAVGGGAS